jgi:hypothetical protein
MSSTPHASRTHSRGENGHGRSHVTSTTCEHRPLCDSFTLRRTLNRGTVQFGSHVAYSSLSFRTLMRVVPYKAMMSGWSSKASEAELKGVEGGD